MTGHDTLTVRMGGVRAGTLLRKQDGLLSFRYDADYMADGESVPLSISLPFSEDEHDSRLVSTWIESLLPDNPRVLANWYRFEQVADRSPFGVLSTQIGFDCAGAVQFCTPETAEHLEERASGITPLSAGDVRREVARIVADPTMWTAHGTEPYFSLGGMQAKIALHRVGQQWARPFGDTPTTHILKPRAGVAVGDELDQRAAAERSRLVAIGEHLCLAAARRLEINASRSWIEQHGPNLVTVVTRFDRRNEGNTWVRVHQEDMCQALGLPAIKKYERDGGPGPSQIGDLIRQHSTNPDRDRWGYADALIYAWLTVNRDAHAKNHSILHVSPSDLQLAPLYDLHSSLFFTGKNIGNLEFATRYGSDFTVYRSSSREMLPTLAARLVLPLQAVVDRAEYLAANVCDAFESEISELPEWAQMPDRMAAFLERLQIRAAACLKTVSATRKR